VTPHLEVLPPAQRAFWYRIANGVPESFVLYGGTAVALRYGHRHSVDFDYFSDRPLDREHLVESLPAIRGGEVLQQSKETLTARIFIDGQPVKLSFFGEIGFGRVGQPDVIDHRVIASPIDLLATKLKTLHDRIEAKDYLDIEALLKAGLTVNQGIAAAAALFERSLNMLDTAKAIAWFKDGGLDKSLPAAIRAYLTRASTTFDPRIVPARILSRSLSPAGLGVGTPLPGAPVSESVPPLEDTVLSPPDFGSEKGNPIASNPMSLRERIAAWERRHTAARPVEPESDSGTEPGPKPSRGPSPS
jgi:hypothetical protein